MRSTHQHIFLCGFMGSGKSSLGKKLAHLLQRPFVDLDQFIETQEKKTVSDIFQLEGEARFRSLEKEVLQLLCASSTPSVIALGGGSITNRENLASVKNAGHLIYLQLSAAALFSRLKTQSNSRPLLKNLSEQEMQNKIEALLVERESSYAAADLTIAGLDLDAQALKQKIVEKGWA